MARHQKRITRFITINVNQSNGKNQRIVAEINRHQFTVITYLLRGMRIKMQRIKEISEPVVVSKNEADLADQEWKEQMTPKWMKKEQAKRAREERS